MSEMLPNKGEQSPIDRNVVLAVVLSMVILLGWQYISRTDEQPATPQPGELSDPVDRGAPERDDPASRPAGDDPAAATADRAADLPLDSEPIVGTLVDEFVVETDLYEVRLSNRGGRALSWGLRDYETADGDPLELLPRLVDQESQYLTLDLDIPGLTGIVNDSLFEVEREPVAASGPDGAGERIVFRWADGRGLEVSKSLTFRNGSYLVDVGVEVSDRGRPLPARLVLGPGFAVQDSSREQSNYYYDSNALWLRRGDVERIKKKDLVDDDGSETGALGWAGLNDQYFAVLVLPADDRASVAWRGVEVTRADNEEGEAAAEPLLSVSVGRSGARLFVGPKKFTVLRALGDDLDRAIWFSSMNWLVPIVKTIFRGLLWIHDHTIPNYGLAIILATFLLRMLLFPINQYAMVSMKRTQLQMQKLQPKMKAIKNKFKKAKDAESRAKMNQEMMELYKAEGVNPMGGLNGCLPLFAQFPILIGFYNMLTVAIELRGAPFVGWIHDLSVHDPVRLLPLAMGVTMFAQQKMAMSKIKDPQQLQQQRIMLFMPVMFTVICLGLPAGMVLYWFVNNLLGIGQQWLVNRHTERLEPATRKA